jgi:hypothetical protein
MFPELRRTKRVGVFGVAYAGGGTYERCIVDPKTKKVSGFVTRWDGGRKFPVGKEEWLWQIVFIENPVQVK